MFWNITSQQNSPGTQLWPTLWYVYFASGCDFFFFSFPKAVILIGQNVFCSCVNISTSQSITFDGGNSKSNWLNVIELLKWNSLYANKTKSECSVILHKKKKKLSELLTAARRDCDRASSVEQEADLTWDPVNIQGWLKALCVGGWQDGWWISVELWAVQPLCQDSNSTLKRPFSALNAGVQAEGENRVSTWSQ